MPLGRLFLDADSDGDAEEKEHEKDSSDPHVIKRRLQTEKARSALASSRAARKASKDCGGGSSASSAGVFAVSGISDASPAAKFLQKKFLTGRLHHSYALSQGYETITDPNQNRGNQRDRARCAWSLLCAIAHALEAIFAVPPANPPVKFVINTAVPDDTNTRLKGPSKGDRSLVFTVMNVIQNCVVCYDAPSDSQHDWHCLSVPCPISVLKAPNREHIHAAYASHLIAGGSGVGQKWKALGITDTVTNAITNAKWAVQVMCGDALEANSAAFAIERKLLAGKRISSAETCRTVAMRIKCCNHQMGLIRRPVVLGIERYWSTLVRLAHLFECAGFRRRFTAALVSLVQRPGVFQCVLND